MLSFEGDPLRMLINLCSKRTVDYGYFCRRDTNLNLDLLTEITENERKMIIDTAATQNQPSFNEVFSFERLIQRQSVK